MKVAKVIICGLLCGLLVSSMVQAQSFLFKLKILEDSAITALSDEKLIDAYIDAEIELEAVSTFFSTSGFTPREFDQYKSLLRFRTDLIREIEKRELDVPRIK